MRHGGEVGVSGEVGVRVQILDKCSATFALQHLGVRWQRCTAQACIGGTAFAGRWMILGHSPPSGL